MLHGGDIVTYQREGAAPLNDFSININPLGLPTGFDEVMRQGAAAIGKYPDIKYRELKKSVARYLSCKPEEIIVGNGATEIITIVHYLARRTLVVTPCFSEYSTACTLLKQPIIEISSDQNFDIRIETISDTLQENDILFLGNPNNPTGKRIPEGVLREIITLVQKKKALLLLDEVFSEFTGSGYDTLSLFSPSPHVVVLRAATKFFGLPGIRLGYAAAAAETAEKINSMLMPWSINAFAEAAGRLLLSDTGYISLSKRHIASLRKTFYRDLSGLPGLTVFPSDANFFLIKLHYGTENDVFSFMLDKGFLIRKASSFRGLSDQYIRIAVKDEVSNAALAAALKEYVNSAGYKRKTG